LQIDIECPTLRQAYPNAAGQTLKWFNSDNEAAYQKNLKHKKNLLAQFKWINADIDYRINRYGFRCEEFTDDPGILWLGCSYTSGIGVREENTFAYQVSHKLGLQNLNLSQAAGSNDTCFRIGSFWIPVLKPKIVVLIKPDEARYEIINEKGCPDARLSSEYKKLWILQKLNRDIQLERNIAGIKYFSYITGARFYDFCAYDIFNKHNIMGDPIHVTDYARDLSHPGITQHQIAAKNLYKQIKKD
jgi:hypothetical protein